MNFHLLHMLKDHHGYLQISIQQIDMFLKELEGNEDKTKTMPKEKQEALNIATT